MQTGKTTVWGRVFAVSGMASTYPRRANACHSQSLMGPANISSQELQIAGLQKMLDNLSSLLNIAVRNEHFYGSETARRSRIRCDHAGKFIAENGLDAFSFEHALEKVCLD